MTNYQILNLSPLQKVLNWIGDKALDVRNRVELDYGTQRMLNGMNVTENYKLIYEKLNSDGSGGWSVKLASGAGAIIQAYTAPTLVIAIDKFSKGLSEFYGEKEIADGIDFFVGGNSNGSLNAAYARVGEVAGDGVASGINKVLNWGGDIFGNNNLDKTSQSIFISTPTTNSSNSVNITQTKPSNNSTKPLTTISSDDYTKSELTDSAKSLIQNEGKNLIGSDINIEGNDGTINGSLLDEMLFAEANKLLLNNTTLQNPILKIDSINNSGSSNNLYLANNGSVVLKDGSTSTLSNIINSIESSLKTTANFITLRANEAYNIAKKQITSDTLIDSLIGSIIADLILGETDPKEIAKNLAESQLKSLASKILDDSFRDLLKSKGFNMSESAINDLLGQPAAGYVVTGDGIKVAVDAAGQQIPINSINGTLYLAVLNFAISAADSSGWNSLKSQNNKLIANDNSENSLLSPQIKMMNHH